MSNFYLLKFAADRTTVEDGVHLKNHSQLLDYLHRGFRMASMEEWDSYNSSIKEKSDEYIELADNATLTQSVTATAENDFVQAGIDAREATKPKKEWKSKHIWLLDKLIKEAVEARAKFVMHEESNDSELTRREAVRMGHNVHLLAGKVADAIMNAKPRERVSEAPYQPGDEVTLNVLLNGLDNQCSGLAGKKMVKLLWADDCNAIEFIAKAYSHNDGKGNPFKPNTGYIARINAAWSAAKIPAHIDASDLNSITLNIEK